MKGQCKSVADDNFCHGKIVNIKDSIASDDKTLNLRYLLLEPPVSGQGLFFLRTFMLNVKLLRMDMKFYNGTFRELKNSPSS